MEGKFGGDLRLGPCPGFLFLSLSTSEKFRDPSVTHLVGIPLLTQRRDFEKQLERRKYVKKKKKKGWGTRPFHALNRETERRSMKRDK